MPVAAVGGRIRTRPAQARDLASMFDAVGAAVRIEGVTLSDKPRVTAMRVLKSDPGRSTIDNNNALSDADVQAGPDSRGAGETPRRFAIRRLRVRLEGV
jgi:hypothetical protein